MASVPLVLSRGTLHTHLGGWAPPVGIDVLLDPLSAGVAALVAVVALLIVGGSMRQVREELPGQETVYYGSVLLMLSGLLGIVITGDLFNLFVQIELASLSAYALVAAGGRGAPRAGLTYLIIGSFGASVYLAGVGFLYAATDALIRVLFWVFGGDTLAVNGVLLDLVAVTGAAAVVAGGVLAFAQTDLRRLLALLVILIGVGNERIVTSIVTPALPGGLRRRSIRVRLAGSRWRRRF